MKNKSNEKIATCSMQNAQQTSKGITLVALVITIIILLILAGVAINMAVNSDGLFAKANETVNGWNSAVGEEKNSVQNLLNHKTPIVNDNIHPMLVDTSSFLWMRKKSTTLQTGDNPDNFYVKASANSTEIKIKSGIGIERLSESDKMWGAVIEYDDGTCEPYIVTAVDTTNNIITIYPKTKKEITNGKFESLYADSQHLSELGYKALMQYVYSVNPKYCDRTIAYDRYAPTSASEMNTPYRRLPNTPELYTSTRNDYSTWSMSQSNYGTFLIPYTNYETEGTYGLEREISLDGREGFYETYIGTVVYPGVTDLYKIVKDVGYELHIEWYIDGNLVSKILKDTNYVEHFCFDIPNGASTAKIKTYYTKMRKDKDDTISIGDSTVWINTGNYGNKIIQNGSTVVQMFDSWGAYWNGGDVVEENGVRYGQGASGKEMQRLLGSNTTYFNRSVSGMTSRYGKAWFNKTVVEKRPNYVLLDYGINDENFSNGATFENVVGPDGNIIDMSVAMTQNEFVNNMYDIFNSAKNNNITPIYLCSSIAVEQKWTTTFITNLVNLYGSTN